MKNIIIGSVFAVLGFSFVSAGVRMIERSMDNPPRYHASGDVFVGGEMETCQKLYSTSGPLQLGDHHEVFSQPTVKVYIERKHAATFGFCVYDKEAQEVFCGDDVFWMSGDKE